MHPPTTRLGGVCHHYVVKRAAMMHLIRVGLPSAVYGDPNALGTQIVHGEEAPQDDLLELRRESMDLSDYASATRKGDES